MKYYVEIELKDKPECRLAFNTAGKPWYKAMKEAEERMALKWPQENKMTTGHRILLETT